jgi:hypothetical protein
MLPGYDWQIHMHGDQPEAALAWNCTHCGWEGNAISEHPAACETPADELHHVSEITVRADDFPYPVLFDQLVIDKWFQMEQIDEHHWQLLVGDSSLDIHIDQYGSARVDVEKRPTAPEAA